MSDSHAELEAAEERYMAAMERCDRIERNIRCARELLAEVERQRWRLVRNHGLLAESRRLIAENWRLLRLNGAR